MRTKRRIAALGAVTLLGAALSLTTAQPALAVGCNENSCTGQDPNTMGCGADASTMDSFSLGANFYVELRYSPACYAVWARVTNTWYSNGGSQNIFVEVDGDPCNPASSVTCTHVYQAVQAEYGSEWTKMITFDDWVRACEVGWPGPPANPASDCTAYH
jgi:hypothetical protein